MGVDQWIGNPSAIPTTIDQPAVPNPSQPPTGFGGPTPPDTSQAVAGGWVFPVLGTRDKGGPATEWGTYEYSNSFNVGRSGGSIHGAIDIYAPTGTEIKVPVTGMITAVSGNPNGDGGWWVTMRGNDGIDYYFAHMNGPALVTGGFVQQGTTIGHVGQSGNAAGTKAHLHFKMSKNGNEVNPYYFLENGVQGYSQVTSPAGGGNDGGGPEGDTVVGYDSSLGAFGTEKGGAIVLPTGGTFYTVGGVKYVAYAIKGPDGVGGGWVFFDIPSGVSAPAGTTMSQAEWDSKTVGGDWANAGSANAFAGVTSGESWDNLIKGALMNMDIWGSSAMEDPEVLQVIAEFIARPSMSQAELQGRLADTAWGRSHTDLEKTWNDKSPAQQNQEIIEKASSLIGTWFTYVGEELRLSLYDSDGNGVISSEELKAENPELYQAALDWASGVKTERELIESWIKPASLETEYESPWSRVLRTEKQAQGQFESDTENQAAIIQQLYLDYGIPISWDEAMTLGTAVEMNEQSIADITEELDAQAMALYPGSRRV